MGIKRNKPQSKGKEESTERVLKKREASQLSDIKFQTMVIRKLMSSLRITRNYREATGDLL